ncbi:MAG: DUF2235 domain-containing protein [Gammaproteobacteria bacterium]
MSRNLVLLSDGTGKRGGVGYETNIWRLYKALVVDDERQLVYYDDGVGSEKSRMSKILGGITAIGMDLNIQQLYGFLVRQWKPGDRIYLFGFSRGAFSVRLLSDMILRCGIIDLQRVRSEKALDQLVKTAYSACLKSFYRPGYAHRFRQAHASPAEPIIQFIGVWDTVGAIGLPFREARIAMHNMMEYGYRGHGLDSRVINARQVFAIDDCRQTFHPVVWDEHFEPSPGRIRQLWFAGVHANVGGGYPKNQLSRVSLEWMIGEIRATDATTTILPKQMLLLDDTEIANIAREKDAYGRLYNSRAGLASAYRLRPRNIDAIRRRYSREIAVIHHSVLDRIRHNIDGYSPNNLPDSFEACGTSSPVQQPGNDENWQACMKAARSLGYLQQLVHFLFMTAILVTAILLLLHHAVDITISLFDDRSIGEAFRDLATGITVYLPVAALGLALSEALQFPLRRRQQQTASRGWASIYPQSRVSGPELQDRMHSGVLFRIAGWLQKIRLLETFHALVAVVIYTLAYTLGQLYRLIIERLYLKPRLGGEAPTPADLNEPVAGKPETVSFETGMYRMHTGLYLRNAVTYRISVRTGADWYDDCYRASPDGLQNPDSLPWFMKQARKLARHPDAEIFTLLGEIDGGEPFTIGSGCDYPCAQDGELVVYVNDVSLRMLFGDRQLALFPDIFYLNNKGSAEITVEAQ